MRHTGTQTIETERLILRKINLNDAQSLYELLIDEAVTEYLAGIPDNYTYEMAVDYIGGKLNKRYNEQNFYDWGIEEQATHKFIGRICVYKQDEDRRMADLVWYISPTRRGKGYMTEAAKAVIKHLQEVGFERIEAFADVKNKASIGVMKKVGMQYEGTLKKYDLRRDDTLYDAEMWAIVKFTKKS